MIKSLIVFSLRVLVNRGRCATDIGQRRFNKSVERTAGGTCSNSIDARSHQLSIIHQRVDYHSHSGHRRTFCTSNHPHLRQFFNCANPPKIPASVESRKSNDLSQTGVEFPIKGSAVNSSISGPTFPKEQNRQGVVEGFWKYGQPRRTESLTNRRNYVVCYNDNMKIPVWVAECLTYECLTGSANRRHSRYLPDLSVRVKARANTVDYRNNVSLSRGHMAAAANNKHDQESMDETFLLTNVLPQDRAINSGLWYHLEQLSRRLTDHYEEVRIISGPLLLPNEWKDGRVFVSYELIGESQVVVPTHLFKIVLADGIRDNSRPSDDHRNPLLMTFVVPNSSKDLETREDGPERYLHLERFLSTLEFVEEKSGFEFFPQMDRKEVLQRDDLGKILQRIFPFSN